MKTNQQSRWYLSLTDPPDPVPSHKLTAGAGKGRYLRLTGKRHSKDGDAAENALPAQVTHSLQPLPAEEPVVEGGNHNLQPGQTAGLRSQPQTAPGQQQCQAGIRGSCAQSSLSSHHSPIPVPQLHIPHSSQGHQGPQGNISRDL